MKTAFVVLTYNRPDTLLKVLEGLAAQCGAQHELIIADDGSKAEAAQAWQQALPRFNCPVKHVWHPDVGFTAARARNLGVAATQADYVVFMDGDCIPNPRFVAAHQALATPGYFVNGSRVLLSESLTNQILAHTQSVQQARLWDWVRWRLKGDVNKLLHLLYWPSAPWRTEQHFRWKKIRSCNFGLWREDFERVNGFDESFQGWGHEDADLVLRLHNAGLRRKNGFLATEVYHLWHKENSRHNEEANRRELELRMNTQQVRAQLGVMDKQNAQDVRVTPLN